MRRAVVVIDQLGNINALRSAVLRQRIVLFGEYPDVDDGDAGESQPGGCRGSKRCDDPVRPEVRAQRDGWLSDDDKSRIVGQDPDANGVARARKNDREHVGQATERSSSLFWLVVAGLVDRRDRFGANLANAYRDDECVVAMHRRTREVRWPPDSVAKRVPQVVPEAHSQCGNRTVGGFTFLVAHPSVRMQKVKHGRRCVSCCGAGTRVG